MKRPRSKRRRYRSRTPRRRDKRRARRDRRRYHDEWAQRAGKNRFIAENRGALENDCVT
ncbi:hypothetical protein DM77_3521 [Burkholderia mallei]|nr:hypothetical protein DM77_3521 [Burkholderia mallei]